MTNSNQRALNIDKNHSIYLANCLQKRIIAIVYVSLGPKKASHR